MRVRDRDGADASQRPDVLDCSRIEESQTIPQQISLVGLNQKCPLTDGEIRLGQDRMQSGLFFPNDVAMSLLQLGQCQPLLTSGWDELPFVLADGTAGRWLRGRRELRAASLAQK